MIRILHSVSNMDRAGIETMLMNYYRNIDKNRMQFDFLCNKTKPGAYDNEIISMGGKIYHTPGLNPAKYPQYLSYMQALFQKHPEYRIIHAHNGAFGVYALHAAKKDGIPVRIFHGHDAKLAFDIKWPLRIFCRSRLPYNCNYHCACGIDAARCYYGDAVIDRGDYKLIHNAIDVNRFRYNEEIRNSLRSMYHLEKKTVIGHIARFTKQKNHTFLIDIFQKIHEQDTNTVLVLLGEGELMEKMKKKIKNCGIEDSVMIMGNVANANEWYQAFDAFVLPSLWEGLPVVGIESQMASLPCIFSDTVTAETKISDKVTFLSLKQKPEAWAATILSKIKENKRIDMEKVITRAGYNIAVEAAKLQSFYERLTEEHK